MTRRRSASTLLLRGLCLVAGLCAACAGSDPKASAERHMKAGDAYVEQQKFHEAVIEFRRAIQEQPRSGIAHLKLGDTYAALGDAGNMVREYLNATEVMPSNVEAQLKAGRALLLAGSFDAARERATTLLAADSTNVEARILLGNSLAALKDLSGAITEVEDAIAKQPERSMSYTNLAILQLAKGNRQLAEAAFKQAVQIDPNGVGAALALGNFYWSSGNPVEAERELARAVALEPKNPTTARALATFYLGTNRAPEAEPYLKTVAAESTGVGAKLVLADYYRKMKRQSEAIQVLHTIANDPDGYVPAQVRIAAMQYGSGARADAHKTIDEVIARRPGEPQPQLVKADFLITEGRLADARKHADAALATAPKSPDALLVIGSLQVLDGKTDAAIESFQNVLKSRPADTKAYVALASIYAGRGDWPVAAQNAQSALQSDPANGTAHLVLARALTERGDFNNADAELQGLLRRDPGNPAVQYALGRFYLLKKDETRARQAFTLAANAEKTDIAAVRALVALDLAAGKRAEARALVDSRLPSLPNSSALQLVSAQVSVSTGDFAAAEAALRKAIALDPSGLDGYRDIASLYIRQGRIPEALAEFEAIVSRNPDSVEAHTMAGILLEQQGKPADAKRHYEAALGVDANAAVAANNLAWLSAEAGDNLDVALQLAQTAKAARPGTPEIDDTLGWIYYKKGLSTLAIAAFERSLASDPKNAGYRQHLQLAMAQNGMSAAR